VLLLGAVSSVLAGGCASRPASYRARAESAMAAPMPVPEAPAPVEEGEASIRSQRQHTSVELASDTMVTGRFAPTAGGAALGILPGVLTQATGGGKPAPPPAVAAVPISPTAPPPSPPPAATSPTSPPSPPATTAASTATAATTAPPLPVRKEMLAVEAHLTIEVPKVREAVATTKTLIAKHGGQLINDVFSGGRSQQSSALSIRVPAEKTEAFLAEIEGLGRVRDRRVTATDVGKQFHDSTILMRNLEITMHRYEELLKTAKDTKDLLAIENELTRLRTQLDNVKSSLAGLGDRVERSTIYLSLQPERDELPEIYEPTAHFYPSAHGTYLYDLGDKSSFLGGGVGVRVSRAFGVDVSGLHPLDGPWKRDMLIATMGGEVYSDFLGGGRKRAGNVFLGARAGILYSKGRTEALIPLTLGVELFRTKTVTIETRVRGDIFFGSSRGAHLGVQPDLGVAFAF
jgi:hypothetical protein